MKLESGEEKKKKHDGTMCFDLHKPKPTLTNNINNQKLMGKKIG